MSVAVSITGVSKTYRSKAGEVSALEPIDLDIAPGAFVSLVGPSGCGKSTLLLMVAGLLARSSGEILVDGRQVEGPQTDIGIVFQGNVLVDWRNALDNVLLQIEMRGQDRARYKERALALLASVGLKDFVARLPHELSGCSSARPSAAR
jgi:NitT/TauT family transport system ATP-binding protein